MLCLYVTNDEFSISGSLVLVVSGYNGGLKDFSQVVDISTGATCTNPPAGVNYPFAMNTGVGTTINGVPLICGGYAGYGNTGCGVFKPGLKILGGISMPKMICISDNMIKSPLFMAFFF